MTNTTNTTETTATNLVAARTTAELAAMILAIESQRNANERGSDEWKSAQRVFLWIADELESRYDVDAAMEAWAADLDTDMTYGEALIAALPKDAI